MADVRTWVACEYASKVANIKITRSNEFTVSVDLGEFVPNFHVGINQLRPLAAALVRVADVIEGK